MTRMDVSEAQIAERLSPLFRSILEVPVFTADLSMADVETWDSLAHVHLLAAIEETFGIEIAFEDAVHMISGRAMIETIVKYLSRA